MEQITDCYNFSEDGQLQDIFESIDEILYSGSYSNSKRRKLLLKCCEKHSISEKEIWLYILKYMCLTESEMRKTKLFPHCFKQNDEKIREKILALIPSLGYYTISDFEKLLLFTLRFLDRLNYVVDHSLLSYLQDSKLINQHSNNMKAIKYFEVLLKELFDELNKINDILAIQPLEAINNSYKNWIDDKKAETLA
jgi:hypothetical protein